MSDPIRWRDPAGGAPAGARELLLRARGSRATTAAQKPRSAVHSWVNGAANLVLVGLVVVGCAFAVLVPPFKQNEPAPRWPDTPPSRAIRLDDYPPWREEPRSNPPRSVAPGAPTATSRAAGPPRAALP
jgi:hypothetical protein